MSIEFVQPASGSTPRADRHFDPPPNEVAQAYPWGQRLIWAATAIMAAVAVAGFWNAGFVDGLGRDVIAGATIGDTEALATSGAGAGFGVIFAMVAGLAATFTACNCVVFAMLPGMACSTSGDKPIASPLAVLAAFVVPMLAVSAAYGLFVGFLGPEGLEMFNASEIRRAKSFAVFSTLGAAMVAWGALELGFFEGLKRRVGPATRTVIAQPTTKAAVMGLMVGLFTVGRPFSVMRHFMTYAAATSNPAYAAVVMMVQSIGQIVVMVALFAIMVFAFGRTLAGWSAAKPARAGLLSGLALLAGGSYFLFYWGAARVWDVGRWGSKLGIGWYQ